MRIVHSSNMEDLKKIWGCILWCTTEPSRLIIVGVIGAFIFICIALAGVVWQWLKKPPPEPLQPQTTSLPATSSPVKAEKPPQATPKTEEVPILAKAEYSRKKIEALLPILYEINDCMKQAKADFDQSRDSFYYCWDHSGLRFLPHFGWDRPSEGVVPLDVIKALEKMDAKLLETRNKLNEISKKYSHDFEDFRPFVDNGNKKITKTIEASKGLANLIGVLPLSPSQALVENVMNQSRYDQLCKELKDLEKWVNQSLEGIENKSIEFEKALR